MISTRLTQMFGLRHPIVLAPMGGVSGGHLAAAVSNAGGLGLVGAGYCDPQWMQAELDLVVRETQAPWGVGVITWAASDQAMKLLLGFRPHAVMLSFGDPRPYAPAIRAAGCKLICQVQDLAGARLAHAAGADLIVAQGTEGGGHGGWRATLPFVPAVVDEVAPTPIVAAGGIADGRGLAAALMLGAQGALIGTRFYATEEALGHPRVKERLVGGHGEETTRTSVFDIARGYDWPAPIAGRALRNAFMQRWHGHESELAGCVDAERPAYWRAASQGDVDTAVVWAGEAVDLIAGVEGAAALVERISAQAESLLSGGAELLRQAS